MTNNSLTVIYRAQLPAIVQERILLFFSERNETGPEEVPRIAPTVITMTTD